VQLLACPICRAPLTRASAVLVCAQRHTFDVAREGYVNLFPAHHRQSRRPGDDERMVAARRRFLDAGHFAPLRVELVATLTQACERDIGSAVDLGCGEGYFTDAVASVASNTYGIDVSKAAIRAAARRYPSTTFAVASSRRLPLVDGSFDAATAILAPIDPDVLRVLANDGVVVRVSPGPDHLRALRDLAYSQARSHRRAMTQLPGVEHVSERRVRFTFDTDRNARADLIAMTPMLHRTREDQRERALAPERLTIEAGFWIDVFRKRH
jgi:23S rRNA (guanine745-N1)-methyltransferase